MDWKPSSWLAKAKTFLREVWAEMEKVSFPAKAEVIATTTVVLVASVIFAVYLWIADVLIVQGYQWIVGKLG